MAYRIANFTNPDTGGVHAEAYARINSVEVNKGSAATKVQFDIYADADSYKTKKRPVFQRAIVFSNAPGGPALFSGSFGAAPVAAAALPAVPASVADILLSQAYVALKSHPQTAAILANAVAV